MTAILQPKPYQRIGVDYVHARDGNALIADEMGLGKSGQALTYIRENNRYPALIIVPAYLKYNWVHEIKKWIDKAQVRVLSGTKPRLPPDYKDTTKRTIYILNYEIATSWVTTLKRIPFQLVVFDEMTYIKNKTAKRSRACRTIATNIPRKLGLTGTPVENRPIDLFFPLSIIKPDLFPSYNDYAVRFCAPKYTGFGMDVSGASNTKQLHRILCKHVMIRRVKADVMKELPKLRRTVQYVDIDNRSEYNKAKKDFLKWVEKTGGWEKALRASNAPTLTRIAYLKKLAAQGKMKECVKWLTDWLASNPKDKIIVFTAHRFAVKAIRRAFKGQVVSMLGGMSSEEKQLAVDRFQRKPEKRIFASTIRAGNMGYNLTAATWVLTIGYEWSPTKHDQAEARAHRIGQTRSVTAVYLLAEKTIEEHLFTVQKKKRRIIKEIMTGKVKKSKDYDVQKEIVKSLMTEAVNDALKIFRG